MVKTYRGFTLVELLIVIVVIAILAAISIVAYNGVQQRARLTQQISEVDKIGKAIQLWSAETGKSLGESGTGYNGNGIGFFYTHSAGSYPATSSYQLLADAGYLNNHTQNTSYMLAPCTDYSDHRWVVLATLNPAPPTTVAEQMAGTGCNSGLITSYSGPSYNRNFAKVY